MEGWRETTRALNVPPAVLAGAQGLAQPSTSAMAFDSTSDLLWTGDASGYVASYYGASLSRYTRFRSHFARISDLLTTDRSIITLSSHGVRAYTRRGRARDNGPGSCIASDPAFNDSTCFAFGSKGTSEVVVAGSQPNLLQIDLDRASIVSTVPRTSTSVGGAMPSVTKMKRHGQYLTMGLSSGALEVVDPNSLRVIKTFSAHSGPISDIDCGQHLVLTCGTSLRKHGYIPDPLVNAFDLRAMKPLPPISFPAGAAFCRIHPKMATSCIIASHSGQLQFADSTNPQNVAIYQVAITSLLSGLEVSASGDFLSLSDDEGFVHLWTNTSNPSPRFTEFSTPLDFPTAQDVPFRLHVEDEATPLSAIGMPYYKEELFSSWSDPRNIIFDVGMPSAPLDRDILANMKTTGSLGYAPYIKKNKPRNLATKYVSLDSMRRSSITVPRFLSEKERTGEVDDEESVFGDSADQQARGKIAKVYRKLEIKYSKFGVNDFDFDFYNKTPYSGLEPQSSNSYCNALLQLYRYSKRLFNFSLCKVATSDPKPKLHQNYDDRSLLIELGFLFDMLHKANGKHCRASNFVSTLSNIPEASNLRLLCDDSVLNLESQGAMLQSFQKFLLEYISHEEKTRFSTDELEQDITGIATATMVKCISCGTEGIQHSTAFSLDLVREANRSSEFLNLVNDRLEKAIKTRGWCETCSRYEQLAVLQSTTSLPEVINMGLEMRDDYRENQVWATKGWLPTEFWVGETANGRLSASSTRGTGDKYALLGFVLEIAKGGHPDNHMVSVIKIKNQWFLFNDFLVKAISEHEALDLSAPWKAPVLVVYERDDPSLQFDYNSWKRNMDKSVLFEDFLAVDRDPSTPSTYELLSEAELPKPGTLVAIDAEFVKVQHEEMEIRSDGTKSILRPQSLSLARVSVVRGEGPKKGVPFIDDYIVTTTPIVDYLTEFSGIEPGDLDPRLSKRGLVTLQTAYKRLWLLLNMGCVFVGHGLSNDFRTINIQVPENQVVDTLDIFFVKARQRKLSLKFLAWCLLDENVQTGNHDSIEDAATALNLYDKYLELKEDGRFESSLSRVYSEGHKYNFRPPGASFLPGTPGTPGR